VVGGRGAGREKNEGVRKKRRGGSRRYRIERERETR
jgi:hypothetical protein